MYPYVRTVVSIGTYLLNNPIDALSDRTDIYGFSLSIYK